MNPMILQKSQVSPLFIENPHFYNFIVPLGRSPDKLSPQEISQVREKKKGHDNYGCILNGLIF